MEFDEEVSSEAFDSFSDHSNEVEIVLDRLIQGSSEDLNELFRRIHTIKGNAAMLQLDEIVSFTHAIEEVVDALRHEKYRPTKLLCEALQLGMDRLRDLHQRELLGHQFENLSEEALQTLFSELARVHEDSVDEYSLKILDIQGAGFVHSKPKKEQTAASDNESIACLTRPDNYSKQDFDLKFFKELAIQVDKQSRYWEGRSEQLLEWAQKVNQIHGNHINENQLAAAVYLHDIGMSFIPAQILEKEDKLDTEERSQIRQHAVWGYELLIRIGGWDEAATIILEHHERIDGKGYPNGIHGDLIHNGAKIISIIDAFFSITNGRADRSSRRSVVRAISEINARVGTQFDSDWVQAFNDMIKQELRSGAL